MDTPPSLPPPPPINNTIPPEKYMIELCSATVGPPMVVRIRRLLKSARRAYGLRCTGCYLLPRDGGGTQ